MTPEQKEKRVETIAAWVFVVSLLVYGACDIALLYYRYAR